MPSTSLLRMKFFIFAAVLCISSAAFGQRYSQTNLVSDISGLAAHTDSRLVNPWGISFGPTSPFWIADNGTGLSTLYEPDGSAAPFLQNGVVIPPPAGGSGSAPTGTVFDSTGQFVVSANGLSGGAIFLFATEDGTLSGWSPAVDLNNAILAVDNSASGAVYKGLASAQVGSSNFLYATNFHNNTVEMYDSGFNLVNTFSDPNVPPRYAPFGIRVINGKLYVTFAEQNKEKHDDKAGPNHGFVDVFDLDGSNRHRLVSRHGLNSPWGLALAPANFGKFSNALLVGNFGNGAISAYDPNSGTFLGHLQDQNGRVLSIDGLWMITFGNGVSTGPANTLFFTAGIDDESHGLFGRLDAIQ
jgi:uncharacterized protein (TIGR03118 family)